MKYQDLADTTSEKAWDAFQRAEQEYRGDPQNREKFLKARDAYKAYDAVRMRLNFPDEKP